MFNFKPLFALIFGFFVAFNSYAQGTAMKFLDAPVQIMGRSHSQPDQSLTIAYPGVKISFISTANKVTFSAISSSDDNYLTVLKDGKEESRIHLKQGLHEYTLLDLESSEKNGTEKKQTQKHRFDLIKDTETYQGVIRLTSLDIHGGNFEKLPEPPARKMMILGDSITCGDGIIRYDGEEKNAKWWRANKTYSWLLSEVFDTQLHLVCYGGRGVVRMWDGTLHDMQLLDYYPMAVPDQANPIFWDAKKYNPDLILITIGTNDFNLGVPNKESFINNYVKLLDQIKQDYPQAEVIISESSMRSGEVKASFTEFLNIITTQTQNKNVHYVPSKHYPGTQDDLHPTAEQHAKMAQDFVPFIEEIMNWSSKTNN